MSTRCQVQVIEGDQPWEKLTLYHHCDGYPSNMLPLIQKAYTMIGSGWKAGRAGQMASYLCATDPGGFEPEAGHELHGDIEYFYTIRPSNQDKHIGAVVKWIVTAYGVPLDCKTVDQMTLLATAPSCEMAERAATLKAKP